jgi:hypothetical protein
VTQVPTIVPITQLKRWSTLSNRASMVMMTPPARETMNDADLRAIAVEKPDSPAYFMLLGWWLGRVLTVDTA